MTSTAPMNMVETVVGTLSASHPAPHARPPAVRIAVGIATYGRAGILRQIVTALNAQTRAPDRIVVGATREEDVLGLPSQPGMTVLFAKPGLCSQRNAIMDAVADCDFLVFLDDDFLMAPDYLQATIDAFATDPAIVVTTGDVIADGAVGPGFSVQHGLEILAASRGAPNQGLEPAFNGYGCNMALRLAAVRDTGLRFDERLPLYGWFEDVDFTRRLGRSGLIMKIFAAQGVHLGVKLGRTSGKRLGYSQIANPIYLALKGSYTWRRVAYDFSRHLAVNIVKSFHPEPYVDRRGRLLGNATAFFDLARGQLRPERILEF